MKPNLAKLFTQTPIKVLDGKKKIHCASPEKNVVEFDVQQGKKYLIVPLNK
jgi:hypothetical protein